MTRWWLFFAVPPTYLQLQPPTSCYDSLVAFFRLCTHLPATSTTNESLRLIGGFSTLLHPPSSNIHHQRVVKTRWWVFFVITATYQQQQPPMSRNDSLVGFCGHSTHLPANSTTNELLQLIGGFSSPPHPPTCSSNHQKVFMTRWWVLLASLPLHTRCRPPTSHCDSLVAFRPPTTTNELLQLIGGLSSSFPHLHTCC